MAYRLKRRSGLSKGLSRIVARQFRAAIEHLGKAGTGEDAIHEVRKSLKKIRAVLRLIRPDLGKTYGIENERLRSVSHDLSSMRDVEAMGETLDTLRRRYQRTITPAISTAIARGLARQPQADATSRQRQRIVTRAVHALDTSASRLEHGVRRVGGSDLVEAGLVRAYRRARKAMKRVRHGPDDVRFHDWRRRSKDHWYHMRLFERINPTAHARARVLKQLDDVLGLEHNLTVLRNTILEAPQRFGGRAATTMAGAIDTQQATLRKRALTIGRSLFAHRASTFQRSVSGWLAAK
jgi:CHAD domain-containing protein